MGTIREGILFKYPRTHYVNNIEAGELLKFRYKDEVRTAVVITPDWKENCDCFQFRNLDEVPGELLQWIIDNTYNIKDGELYDRFKQNYSDDFRSFKRKKMTAIEKIEFVSSVQNLLRDAEEDTKVEEKLPVVDKFKKIEKLTEPGLGLYGE